MSIDASKTTAMLASAGAVALFVVLLGATLQRFPSSTAAGTTEAVVRGGGDDWYEFSYPTGWYEVVHGHAAVQNLDPDLYEGGPDTLAVMTIYRGRKACDDYDCTSWPPTGTVLSAVTIDGIPATRYDLPNTGFSPAIRSDTVVDLHKSPFGTYFQLGVVNATQQELDDHMADLDAIIANMNIISGNTDTSAWVEHQEDTPGVPMLDEYWLLHPAGWMVSETPTQIIVSGPNTSAVEVTVAFESGRPLIEWDAATHILGATWLREISDQIVGGTRVITFMREHPDLPMKIVATVPNTPYGSDDYWKDEQTVWAIISQADIRYAPGVHDPYP